MKSLFIYLTLATFISIVFVSCDDDPDPINPNPIDTTDPNLASMNALEQSLVGEWKCKRVEHRSGIYYNEYGDSLSNYVNYYNYTLNHIYLYSIYLGEENAKKYYSGEMCMKIFYGVNMDISWYAKDNYLYLMSATIPLKIIHVSSDSLVLDDNSNNQRLYFNKNSTAPEMSSLEKKLVGKWVGQVPNNYLTKYLTFKEEWNFD
jgi:hypothetical protein